PIRQQIPARRHELLARQTTTVVHRLRLARETVRDDLRPDDVAVAPHHGMRRALDSRFVWKQRRVNPAVDDVRAARPDLAADFVPAKRVAGVDADADDVPGIDGFESKRL